jgi:phage/plasmid-associated DNA primase
MSTGSETNSPPKNRSATKLDPVQKKNKLEKFLRGYTVSSGRVYTHGRTIPGATFFFKGTSWKDEELGKFWMVYCNYIISEPKETPTYTEKPTRYTPLRVDIDFKLTEEAGLKMHITEEQIEQIIQRYQIEIANVIDEAEYEDKHIYCIRLDKAPYYKEDKVMKYVKNGYHLHFPNFVCESRMFEYIRGKVQQWIQTTKLFSDIPQKYIYENVSIDEKMGVKPWLLYGSATEPTKKPYLWGCAYDEDMDEITMADVFEEKYNELKEAGKKARLGYYLPLLMSVRRQPDEKIKLRSDAENKLNIFTNYFQNNRTRKTPIIKRRRTQQEILEDYKKIKDMQIMDMLSVERAENYGTWMDVGWTLFNITDGQDEGLELWKEFSQRSKKYDEGVCDDKWGHMELKNKTLASLLFMAKQDNPEQYELSKTTHVNYWIYEAIKEQYQEYDIYMVFKAMYNDRFLCANVAKSVWYEFTNHRWCELDDAHKIRQLLPMDVRNKFYEVKASVQAKKFEIMNGVSLDKRDKPTQEELDRMEQCDFQLKNISGIMNDLKKVCFIDKVIKMAKSYMINTDFVKKHDENKLLLGCENGVLDLELRIFREGRPDDMITKTTGIYYHNYSPNDDIVREVEALVAKTHTNPRKRKYFMDFLALTIRGGNVNKKFLCHTGTGDNGKSICMELLEKALGEYCFKFPREMMLENNRNNSGGPRPELARAKGARVGIISEIADHEKINIGVLKELTGNDTFYARTLRDKGGEIKPMFTVMLQCNKLPKIPAHDQATWNRVRVLEYESFFDLAQKAPPDVDEQFNQKHFNADPAFSERLTDLAPAFLWLLFNRYNSMKSLVVEEPAEVIGATGDYRSENDVYVHFINEKIEKIGDLEEARAAECITLAEMYSEFDEWFKENYPSYAKSIIGRNELRKELSKAKKLGVIKTKSQKPESNNDNVWGCGKRGTFYGYRFILDEDDDDMSVNNRILTNKPKGL